MRFPLWFFSDCFLSASACCLQASGTGTLPFFFFAGAFFFAANYCLCPISRITGSTIGRLPVVLNRYLETLSRI